MAQDLEAWSACDGALKLAQKRWEESAGKLGLPPRADFGSDFMCPLGQEDFDLWVLIFNVESHGCVCEKNLRLEIAVVSEWS